MNIIKFTILFLLWPCLADIDRRPDFYLGHKRSQAFSSELNAEDFLDFKLWRADLSKRETLIEYFYDKQDLALRERGGLVMSCVGSCLLYRGEKFSRAKTLSTLREGDILQTLKDSYLWLFLMDGTLVRLSPESSWSFLEINLAPKDIFFYSRLNYGNVLWLSRDRNNLKRLKPMETDQLFIPFPYLEANGKDGKSIADQVDRLNHYVTKNNKVFSKKTTSLIVMPNGSVWGESMAIDLVSIFNGKSYIYNRSAKKMGSEDNQSRQKKSTSFLFRGFNNSKETTVEEDRWYVINEEGSDLSELRDESPIESLQLGQLVTSFIPTVLMARELFLQEFSRDLFYPYSRKVLGEKFGYRLWSGFGKGEELTARLDFLKGYSRRSETTQRRVLKDFWERKVNIAKKKVNDRFYARALSVYAKGVTKKSVGPTGEALLNSEKKKFWKVIHGKR